MLLPPAKLASTYIAGDVSLTARSAELGPLSYPDRRRARDIGKREPLGPADT